MNTTISVEATVLGDIQDVWGLWTEPEHIKNWMHASDDWECTNAINDVRVGGRYVYTLGAKDKSVSFDLPGTYTQIEKNRFLASTLGDGREVVVTFTPTPEGVHIVQTFEPEKENPESMQKDGWQATLDSFKMYAEEKAK
jgi:uncharacterized protein YndB with AHSA1/START domain